MQRSAAGFTRYTGLLIAALAFAFGIALASAQWSVQPQQSTLTFVATQAGAKFQGAFDKFDANIVFDPQNLPASRFDVKIDMTSVNTRDGERDGIIKGADLFAVQRWPSGHYVADRFKGLGGGKYAATGKLTLRDVTRDVPIRFTFTKGADGAWLKGSTVIKRLDFGIGQGEWRDTGTVGDEVEVRFALLLKP